ncbi:hypothetical protein [Haloterrigena alkaliphila]|uniref:Uncharacterized protein n=1 Tax=Haloterrigena alkaliphila TaxID=2816475 RepID=A0A8A2VF64_9EURY|nr:hypothetical protein [Haloterrigena alkaliphila]QSW98992.1 hypothetical protein J0X25_16655 [Haloterrigena alkaliphila]
MRFATPTRNEWEGWGDSTAVIVAMGLALAVAGTVRTLGTPVSHPVVAFELFVSLLVPTGLATGGYWLASCNVSPDVRWRAATRVSIGIVAACALGVWLVGYVALEGGAIRDPLSLVTTLAAVGGATGFLTAVREPQGVAPVESIDSSDSSDETDEDGTEAPAATTTPTATTVSTVTGTSAPAGNESESTLERPTAAAAGTTTADETAADTTASDASATTHAPAITDAPTTTDASATTETPSPSGVSPDADVWAGTDDPAHPLDPAARLESGATDASPRSIPEPGVDAVAAVPSTAETVLEVLRRERARIALAILYHEWDEEPRPVDELARAVSYHTDADPDTVAVGLRHSILPELREIRAVDWDSAADRVSASEHAVFEEGVREASVLLESFEPGTR